MVGNVERMPETLESLPQPAGQDASTGDLTFCRGRVDAVPLSQCPPHLRRVSSSSQFDLTISPSTTYAADNTSGATGFAPGLSGDTMSFLHRNLGLLLIAGAQVFFSMMNLFAKILSVEDPLIHPSEIIFVRMLITWLATLLYLHCSKVPDYLVGPKGVRLLLVARGILGFFGLFGIYYSLQHLDLSDATVLTFLAPILTCYFGRIFLKESVLGTELCVGFLSLFGVILIARPQSLFGTSASPNTGTATGLQRLAAIGVALIGVICTSAAYISIRAIGSRAHPLLPVSMFALYSTLLSGIGLAVSDHPFVIPHTSVGWAAWIAVGISGFVAQLLLTAGLQREKAGRGSSMIYLQMVFAFASEW